MYDGNDRWLQRLVVERDLLQSEIAFGKRERILSWTADSYFAEA
jgi:hypothetical protein